MLAAMRAIASAPLLAALALALGGCPSRSNGSSPSPSSSSSAGVSATCTTFGQSCVYAPGKLGSCVTRTDCTGDGCLVCQSQHQNACASTPVGTRHCVRAVGARHVREHAVFREVFGVL